MTVYCNELICQNNEVAKSENSHVCGLPFLTIVDLHCGHYIPKNEATKKCCADCGAYVVPSGYSTTPFKLTNICESKCGGK